MKWEARKFKNPNGFEVDAKNQNDHGKKMVCKVWELSLTCPGSIGGSQGQQSSLLIQGWIQQWRSNWRFAMHTPIPETHILN